MKKIDNYYIVQSRRTRVIQLFRKFTKWFLLAYLKLQALFRLPDQSIESVPIKRILIFGYMGIGDLIMFTPALQRLREEFPEAQITLQTDLRNSCDQVIKNSNLIDDIYNAPLDKNFFKFIKTGRKLKNRFDLLIAEFHNPYFELAFQTIYMNIPLRIGHTSSPGFQNPFDFLFNYPIKMQEAQHTIDRNLSLLLPLGLKYQFETEKRNTKVYLSESDREYAESFWKQHQLSHKTVIGIQGGTAPLGQWKQWPPSKFQALIQILFDRSYFIILFGSPGERQMLEKLAAAVQPKPYIFAGTGPFLQACALINKCQYMITNDSGLMHVANALNTPLTAIYGPTDYRRTAPLVPTSTIVRLDLPCSPCFRLEGDARVRNCPYQYRCLNDLDVEMVLNAIQLEDSAE